MRYRIEFLRIGRNRAVPPLTVVANTVSEIEAHIYRYAERHLQSPDFIVSVDLKKLRGWITCGFFLGRLFDDGRFTLTPEGGSGHG